MTQEVTAAENSTTIEFQFTRDDMREAAWAAWTPRVFEFRHSNFPPLPFRSADFLL